MREFKFRTWHKKRKRMYKVLHLHAATTFEGPWSTVQGFDIIDQKNICIRVQPNDGIIMQYIGLKDKNMVEIYEGDITLIRYCDGEFENMVVKWSDEKHGFRFFDVHGEEWIVNDTEIEVVGNMYENPELMEVNHE